MTRPGKPLAQRWHTDVDRLLLDPARLFVMGVLVTSPDYFRFGYLCENAGITKAVLARHVRRLRHAGYVETRRGACNQLWIRTTSLGQQRFKQHVTATQEAITRARDVGKSARFMTGDRGESATSYRAAPLATSHGAALADIQNGHT